MIDLANDNTARKWNWWIDYKPIESIIHYYLKQAFTVPTRYDVFHIF